MLTASQHAAGTILDEIGLVGWAAVYVFSIHRGFKDKSYGIPLVAICLNVTWELFFAGLCNLTVGGDLCFTGPDLRFVQIWAIFDLIIFYQLLRFGRAQQTNPLLKHPVGFYASIAAFLLVGYLGQTTFITSHHDTSGDEMAWISSLIMNILFILAVFEPRGTQGLSLPAAWAKLVANSCIALSLIAINMEPFKHQFGFQFIYFLFGAVFLTDCGYLAALYWRRRQPVTTG